MSQNTQSLKDYLFSRTQNRLGLMTHIIVGYPSLEANWELLCAMEEAGVDIVEMQFPFSEPVADGPLFSKANQASLENGTKIHDCFDLMKRASETFSFPILMMGYYNTVFAMGEEAFCAKLAAAGGRGLIVPDLPIEDVDLLLKSTQKHNLEWVGLVAPTNTPERIGEIAEFANRGQGLVYAVARKGTTGTKTQFDDSLNSYFAELQSKLQVPLAVGFGVSEKADMDFLKGKIDLAVVGSALLKTYQEKGIDGVKLLLNDLLA